MDPSYTIGLLAKAAGVHVETVRYYHRRGLLKSPEQRGGSRVRRYSQADVERLRFIKRSQGVGFSLTEIQELLKAQGSRSCSATLALVSARLRVVEERIRDLGQLRDELRHWVAECESNATQGCPVLDALETATVQTAARQRSPGRAPAISDS